MGKTGSGKTTAANILLNLLKPKNGDYFLDSKKLNSKQSRNWQKLCAYVPQSINLLNDTILSNIAFAQNDNEINIDRVWDSIKLAQIEDLILSMPKGIFSIVGENGIRMSGGQRQRIALARAFYREAKFVVLDEATSALDNKTEAEFINELNILNRKNKFTLVLIAHRLSTVKNCDQIYFFKNGSIADSGSYESLIKTYKTFRDMAHQ